MNARKMLCDLIYVAHIADLYAKDVCGLEICVQEKNFNQHKIFAKLGNQNMFL